MTLDQLLTLGVEQEASDLHLQAGSPPMLRIGGQVRRVEAPSLTVEQMRQLVGSAVPPAIAEDFDPVRGRGAEFAFDRDGPVRFRAHLYSHLGTPGLAIRFIRHALIPSIEELHLPPVIRDIALAQRGLTLLTGAAGSGKSTTLAAMIHLINQTYPARIVTIEDPVEYLHTGHKALISHLAVGIDTPSFEDGLRQALRLDPDVILVGELCDPEVVRLALIAADTGRQVLSAVPSSTAAQTIERLLAMMPATEQRVAAAQLAGSIQAIISQRLVATKDGGRRPAVEILRGGPETARSITEGRLGELADYITTGEGGMQRFDQHLIELYRVGLISGTEAMRAATNPEAVAVRLRGAEPSGPG